MKEKQTQTEGVKEEGSKLMISRRCRSQQQRYRLANVLVLLVNDAAGADRARQTSQAGPSPGNHYTTGPSRHGKSEWRTGRETARKGRRQEIYLKVLKVDKGEVKGQTGRGAGRDKRRKDGMARHLVRVNDRLKADSRARTERMNGNT